MDEETVIHLLSRIVKHILADLDLPWTSEQQQEVSDRLSDAAWRGLILLLRQTLATDRSVILDEFGRFEKAPSGWVFEPAASLVEATALQLPPTAGYISLAHEALYRLEQGLELIKAVPTDVELPRSKTQIELDAALGGLTRNILSQRIKQFADTVAARADELSAAGLSRAPQSAERAHDMPPSPPQQERGSQPPAEEGPSLGYASE